MQNLPSNLPPQRGFSLIVTVTMMILLSLIAVGLLSLSTTVLRSSGHTNAEMVARANARMALQMAIGELQKSLGPDTRVTANGSILEGREPVGKGNQHLLGVWNAWQQNPLQVGNYDQQKQGEPNDEEDDSGAPLPNGGFHRWLASSRDDANISEVSFISDTPQEPTVQLVPETQAGQDEVRVAAVALNSADGRNSGRYAWAVFDENQKAALNPSVPDPQQSTHTPLQTVALQQEPAWENSNELKGVASIPREEREKLLSNNTMKLASVPDAERYFHDVTAFSSGLLTDVTKGGMKKDLSLLFQDEELPNSFSEEKIYLYSGTQEGLIDAPDRGDHPFAFPSPDPKWSLLHQFHRIPLDHLNGSGESARLSFNMQGEGNDSSNSFPFRMRNLRPNTEYHDALKLSPVISKAQFIFSITYTTSNSLYQNSANWRAGIWRHDPQGENSEWTASAVMYVDPVITLWNPYDIPMDVEDFRIYLYRIPLAFGFKNLTHNDWRTTKPFFDFAEMGFYRQNRQSNGNGDINPIGFPLAIKSENPGEPLVLLPGEHRVFSAHNRVTLWQSIRDSNAPTPTLEMKPGWNPPSENSSSNADVGGIEISYLCPDPDNWGHGAEYIGYPINPNKPRVEQAWGTPHILVKQGDQLGITVKPSVSDAGNFETVGKQSLDFYLRYGEWVSDDKIKPKSEHKEHSDFGAIEFNFGPDIEEEFTQLDPEIHIPVFPIESDDIDSNKATAKVRKKPFLAATLHLKSLIEESSSVTNQYPSKAWLHSNPTLIYASAGMGGDTTSLGAQQYQFTYEPIQGDWLDGNVPEIGINERDQGFGGPSPGVTYGRPFAPFVSLPREAPTSLAQFRHAPLNQSGQHPLQAQVLANSFAHPLLAQDKVVDTANKRLDHSFLANLALFDSTFLSSAQNDDALIDALDGKEELPNSRFQVSVPTSISDPSGILNEGDDSYRKSAAFLSVDGAFNVNSTSKLAWMTLLSGFTGEDIPALTAMDSKELGEVKRTPGNPLFSRYNVPLEETLGDNLDEFGTTSEGLAWTGQRRLNQQEIEQLAEQIVVEVKRRGPFQSLAEFVNRRAEKSELAQVGCLQAAIDNSGLNEEAEQSESLELSGTEPGSESFENTEAAEGNSMEGTPGYLTQGDLLHTIAPILTVRADTFKVRTYGAATDRAGRVISEAWCEAIVQRSPDFLDSANQAYDYRNPSTGEFELSETNRKFGRRFNLISFRWLRKEEAEQTVT